MRKLALILAVLILAALIVAFYPTYVEKPLKDGPGPLSVYVAPRYAAPEYHNPLDYWQTHHQDIVNRGDVSESDCLYCHEIQRSCNNCHDYVGSKEIIQ
jgi:hypothetical protein